MDTKLVIKPRMIGVKLLSMAALALLFISHSVSAEEFLCDATQASTSELPVLDSACPIGKGLWGNQKPKEAESSFWIQCGVLSKPLSLAKAKSIYQHISTDVWSKPEEKGYRCLIGPYNDFSKARQELRKVKTEHAYKEAFIREVVKTSKSSSAPVAKVVPITGTAVKKAEGKSTATSAPVIASTSSKMEKESDTKVVIRLKATVAGLEYRVPYTDFEDGQFYMEHAMPWNRLNYESATEVCDSMDMRLPLDFEWTQLLEAAVMLGDNWPMHLPYWGFERKGLFTSGKISQLKGTSLLNVLCVK
ncbi:SPOR domain-containing protein [Vibrio sp. ZSDE26]|uniref:SPOR domain-containing protein n=1 Tax=Vibrio amylolyticus TaxID=2847292 RepID=A0A9X1XMN0_9VIBR|nr:SPOR domain-containing protein [Vibrio amylolyticus]MCK6265531.1 SPOR domain-containing protein [Vibrio amylolyticus]